MTDITLQIGDRIVFHQSPPVLVKFEEGGMRLHTYLSGFDAHGIWGGINPGVIKDLVKSTPADKLPAAMLQLIDAWKDVQETDVLDGARGHKESDQERHVCPLQLEVIRRLVELYTNPAAIQPDVLVLDPFMGIGSTAHVCIEQGRNVVGFELKESYHRAALENVQKALAARDVQAAQSHLFAGGEVAA